MDVTDRPSLKPALLVCGIITGLMLAITAWAWAKIPADQLVPTHWGLNGQVDGYGSKTVGLLGMPLTALFMMVLMTVITLVEPRRRNILQSIKPLSAIVIASLVMFLAIHVFAVFAALGKQVDMGFVMPLGMGVLFVVIGNYMGKLRSNYFAGTRTPWTLSSELSWNKSNRLSGKLFMLLGVIMALGGLVIDAGAWTGLMIAEVVILGAIVTIYSYLVWKADPARIAAETGVQPAPPQGRAGYDNLAVAGYVLIILAAIAAFGIGQTSKPGTDMAARHRAGIIADPGTGIVAKAQKFVSLVATGDYAAAEKGFDTPMKQALPPGRLKVAWESLIAQNGQFIRQSRTKTESIGAYQVVYVRCKFERARVDVKVVFNQSGQVSGLWFVPPQPGM